MYFIAQEYEIIINKLNVKDLMKFNSKFISASLIANFTISPLLIQSAIAGNYNAICDQVRCFVKLDNKGINSPDGFMSYKAITSWSVAGDEEHTTGMGAAGAIGGAYGGAIVGAAAACTTIVLCPVAIIGGGILGGRRGSQLGSSSYYSFIVRGYDKYGDAMTHTFDIDKKKITKNIMKKLKKNSGLSIGEYREVNVYEIMGD